MGGPGKLGQGRIEAEMSAGARPPAAAQASRNHVSQSRGLSFHRLSVAKIEKSIAASRPLHSAPEPS